MKAKPKLIVIEGPDGVGKTTIAKFIASESGFKYKKFSNPPNQDAAYKEYIDWLSSRQPNTVCDRSWLGEFVYAPLFRNYAPDYLPELETLIKETYDILYILIIASRKWAARHCLDTGKPPYKNTDITKVGGRYDELVEKFIRNLNNLQVGGKFLMNPENYGGKTAFQTWGLDIAGNWLKGENFFRRCNPMYALTYFNPEQRFVLETGRPRWASDFKVDKTCTCGHFKDHKLYPFWKQWHSITWGVGNVANPKVVFVGEAPGMNGCGTTGIPFYFDRSGFLFKWLLFKLGVAESEYYLTNICKCTPKNNDINPVYASVCGHLHLIKELNEIGGGTIVALGNTARDWLEQEDVRKEVGYSKIYSIYHPAWALYKNAPDQYEDMFNSLCKEVDIKRRMLPV
jgi:uracil-DNA glycosylase family 4